VLVAIGIDSERFRHVLGVRVGAKEDKAAWSGCLRHLKKWSLRNVQLVASHACSRLMEAGRDSLPVADGQRCTVHFYRNMFTVLPKGKIKCVARMPRAIHASEHKQAGQEKSRGGFPKEADPGQRSDRAHLSGGAPKSHRGGTFPGGNSAPYCQQSGYAKLPALIRANHHLTINLFA
jgi:Transposase, Mutator family